MHLEVSRYYELKNRQKEIEQELSELRGQILAHCEERGVSEMLTGDCKVRLVRQLRKEYDEERLYEALPDPEVWRLLAKPDASRIASLVKLGVLKEEQLKNTYGVKEVTLLQVERA